MVRKKESERKYLNKEIRVKGSKVCRLYTLSRIDVNGKEEGLTSGHFFPLFPRILTECYFLNDSYSR